VHAFEITINGELIQREVLRKDVAIEFSMHGRDLRPVFSIKQLATVSTRGKGIIVNLGELKLIIGEEKIFLFNIRNPFLIQFAEQLAERIKNQEDRTTFEFMVLEFSFSYVYTALEKDFYEIEKSLERTFAKLKNTISDQYFEGLLTLKKRLSKLSTLVREIEEASSEVVKDEEELVEICLSKKTTESVEEAESILEHIWEQYEDLDHRIEELSENIDDTQEIITLKMANRRNVIMRFDLLATLITAVLSGLAVIAGVFGMNLKNNFEESMLAFLFVVALIFIVFALSVFWLFWYLRKNKVW
jgi:magnesium transporter